MTSRAWVALMLAPLLVAIAALAAATPARGAASTGAAAAAGNGAGAYQVEIVIFRAASAPAGGEDLSANAEGRGFNHQFDSSAIPPTVYRTLEASQMQLGGIASRLRANGYRVLAHAGWVQGATDWPHHAGLPLEQVGVDVTGLSGSVYVERGQFLHLGFNLRLGDDPAWSLSELRKIRFNEKNYFDHPGFGVIAIVSPAARGTG
jgi:hypothetical protein